MWEGLSSTPPPTSSPSIPASTLVAASVGVQEGRAFQQDSQIGVNPGIFTICSHSNHDMHWLPSLLRLVVENNPTRPGGVLVWQFSMVIQLITTNACRIMKRYKTLANLKCN